AVQGTVWFVAHVVAVAIGALYLLCALDAEYPALSGLLLGLGFLTRTPLLFAFPLFLLEAARVTSSGAAPDRARFARLVLRFALPLVVCFGLALVYNKVRFGKPLDFGY